MRQVEKMATAEAYLWDDCTNQGGMDGLDQLRANHILALSQIKLDQIPAFLPAPISPNIEDKSLKGSSCTGERSSVFEEHERKNKERAAPLTTRSDTEGNPNPIFLKWDCPLLNLRLMFLGGGRPLFCAAGTFE